jgi:hypothetical protein
MVVTSGTQCKSCKNWFYTSLNIFKFENNYYCDVCMTRLPDEIYKNYQKKKCVTLE